MVLEFVMDWGSASVIGWKLLVLPVRLEDLRAFLERNERAERNRGILRSDHFVNMKSHSFA